MNSYLDTSALVKLVIVERDTDVVTTLWSRVDDPYSSLLGYAEMRAAVASAIRAGRVPAFDDAAVRQTLDGVWRHMIGVEVDDRVVRAAGDLADRHGLRAAHAIHLASAIRILEADTAFITFDARLREAAAAEGFMVLPETV